MIVVRVVNAVDDALITGVTYGGVAMSPADGDGYLYVLGTSLPSA